MFRNGTTRRAALGGIAGAAVAPHVTPPERPRDQAAGLVEPQRRFVATDLAAARAAGEASTAKGAVFLAIGMAEGVAELRLRSSRGSDLVYEEITARGLLAQGGKLVGLADGAKLQEAVAVAATPGVLLASAAELLPGSTIRTGDGHVYKVLSGQESIFDIETAGGAKLEVQPGPGGVYEMAAWALDESGATDVGDAFVAALTRARKMRLTPGAEYLFADYKTVENVSGVRLWCEDAVIRAEGLPHPTDGSFGVLTFKDCPGARVHDFEAHGDEDVDTWIGMSTMQRMVPRALLRFENCPAARIHNPVTSGLPNGVAIDEGSARSRLYHPEHVGICGPVGAALPDEAYAGAGVVVRGAHWSTVFQPFAREVAQGVLGQASVVGLKVAGGTGDEIHNVGVYVSSGHDCSVKDYTVVKVKGDGIKMRGSRHRIAHCDVLEGAEGSTGFVISGLISAEAIDALGAVGEGSRVLYCTATNVGALATVRLATIDGKDYAMRDVEVVGCQGFDLTNDAAAPITVFVVKGANVAENYVDASDAAAATQVLGMEKDGAVGIRVRDNRFGTVLRGVEVLNATAPVVDGNTAATASESFFIRFTNCHAPTCNDNLASSLVGDILDIRAETRSITGVAVACRNHGRVSADTDQQWFGANNADQTATNTLLVSPTRRGQIVRSTMDGKTYIAAGSAALQWVPLE